MSKTQAPELICQSVTRWASMIGIAVILCAGFGGPAWAGSGYEPVSLVSLIADPHRYEGKRVAVSGYAVFGWESSLLFLSPYDAQEGIVLNAIQLDTAQSPEEKLRMWREFLDHETITVEGTFHYQWNKSVEFEARRPNGIIDSIARIRLNEVRPQRPAETPRPK